MPQAPKHYVYAATDTGEFYIPQTVAVFTSEKVCKAYCKRYGSDYLYGLDCYRQRIRSEVPDGHERY